MRTNDNMLSVSHLLAIYEMMGARWYLKIDLKKFQWNFKFYNFKDTNICSSVCLYRDTWARFVILLTKLVSIPLCIDLSIVSCYTKGRENGEWSYIKK